MKTTVSLFASIPLLIAPATLGAKAHQSVSDVELCASSASQAETLECYLDAAAKSQAQLSDQFKLLLRSANDEDRQCWNFSNGLVDCDPPLSDMLNTSQAEWLNYSSAQCALEGRTSYGGSGDDILEAACQYRLNSERLSELKATYDLVNRAHSR